METAERSRAPVQKLAEVIIVAGACGIAAGTPLAILGAIGRAARQGAIVKGGLYLELLARVDTAVFDKTGTLTYGRPEVRDLRLAPGVSERQLVEAAAVAERCSEHPLAQAVLRRAVALGIVPAEPAHFDSTPGRGVVARLDGTAQDSSVDIVVANRTFLRERGVALSATSGNGSGRVATSEILVARGGRYLGALHVADTTRPEAAEAVQALTAMGIRTILLTGDTRPVAEAVGLELGVGEAVAELLPEAKLRRVQQLVQAGCRRAPASPAPGASVMEPCVGAGRMLLARSMASQGRKNRPSNGLPCSYTSSKGPADLRTMPATLSRWDAIRQPCRPEAL